MLLTGCQSVFEGDNKVYEEKTKLHGKASVLSSA